MTAPPAALTVLRLFVPGEPQPKARPRVVRVPGSIRSAVAYTPKSTKDAEATIGWHIHAAYLGLQVDADHNWSVVVFFYSNRRADIDNLAKTVLDACNNIVWRDDSQVTTLHAERGSLREGHEPGTDILLERGLLR